VNNADQQAKDWSGVDRERSLFAEENQTAKESVEKPEVSFEAGTSIVQLAHKEINPHDTLLGERYLCRGGGLFHIAPTGGGKSSLSFQDAILWSSGLPSFGIAPHGPLRNLIIQAEDDIGDQIEMARMIKHIELSKGQRLSREQIAQIDANTEVIRCANLVRDNFIAALRKKLETDRRNQKPWDLVTLNPYTSYLGGDVKDAKLATYFLRELLTPVLLEYNVGAKIIHHTAKTTFQNTDKYKLWDWMYYGAGCAEISNWARGIMVMKPVTDDMKVFRFIAAKRGVRIGGEWEDSFDRYFAHSPDPHVICWHEATPQQIAEATAQASKQKFANPEIALKQIPLIDPELKSIVIKKIQAACSCGKDLARETLTELIASGRAFHRDIQNPRKAKGCRPFAGVSKMPG
jgi:hypothetical protein